MTYWAAVIVQEHECRHAADTAAPTKGIRKALAFRAAHEAQGCGPGGFREPRYDRYVQHGVHAPILDDSEGADVRQWRLVPQLINDLRHPLVMLRKFLTVHTQVRRVLTERQSFAIVPAVIADRPSMAVIAPDPPIQ